MGVAHIGDQPYWGRRIYELGVGGPPLRRHKMTAERLAAAIRLMLGDDDMQRRAAALAVLLRSEDGVGNAVRALEKILNRQPQAPFRRSMRNA